MIYLIGSLRNPHIPDIAQDLRYQLNEEIFDDWYSPGPHADEEWQKYEQSRGRTFQQALSGWHAKHVFAFDKFHLDRCRAAVLVQPAGKSGHLELGYVVGQGKPGFILLDGEPERYDIMVQFAKVVKSIGELLEALNDR